MCTTSGVSSLSDVARLRLLIQYGVPVGVPVVGHLAIHLAIPPGMTLSVSESE